MFNNSKLLLCRSANDGNAVVENVLQHYKIHQVHAPALWIVVAKARERAMCLRGDLFHATYKYIFRSFEFTLPPSLDSRDTPQRSDPSPLHTEHPTRLP
jgi:hypothetical protein